MDLLEILVGMSLLGAVVPGFMAVHAEVTWRRNLKEWK